MALPIALWAAGSATHALLGTGGLVETSPSEYGFASHFSFVRNPAGRADRKMLMVSGESSFVPAVAGTTSASPSHPSLPPLL